MEIFTDEGSRISSSLEMTGKGVPENAVRPQAGREQVSCGCGEVDTRDPLVGWWRRQQKVCVGGDVYWQLVF